jgi:hypothetical protein
MKSKTLLLLLIPLAFFVVGSYLVWRATFRGTQVYPLMIAFGFIFAGIVTIISVFGLTFRGEPN